MPARQQSARELGQHVERIGIEHGAPVSFLVSASHGIGMTEGFVEISDEDKRVRISVDREIAPLLGLLTHRRAGNTRSITLAEKSLPI